MEALQGFFLDFLQALAARVMNFAHGDFMMLGMYVAFYLVTGFGVLGFLGPYAGPIVGAVLAGPIVFAHAVHRTAAGGRTGVKLVP